MKKESINKRFLIIIILFLLISTVLLTVLTKHHQKKEKNYVILNALVKLDEGKITITNNDSFDYVNTELYINNHYKIFGFNFIAGESSTLWQVEFSDSFKRRMNPNKKAITFSILCDLYDDRKGVYYIDFSKKQIK